MSPDRVVIGGGLFGCFAALLLADRGFSVLLVEKEPQILGRASFVNQARLHTGLHYPRSLLTAIQSRENYMRFRKRWPQVVIDFDQIYAIAKFGSKTSVEDFVAFAARLGQDLEEIDPDLWFESGTITGAFRVTEPTLDVPLLRRHLFNELNGHSNIRLQTSVSVTEGRVDATDAVVKLSDGTVVDTERVVLAAYASTNACRRALGFAPMDICFEQAEVILGRMPSRLRQVGFTIMDGPFWSAMPFGRSGFTSLTTVGLTPLHKAVSRAEFPCQLRRWECTPDNLQDCSSCKERPDIGTIHQVRQMSHFLIEGDRFSARKRLMAVKAIPSNMAVDDARPTIVEFDAEGRLITVLSGKLSSIFDLHEVLI